MSKVQKSSDDVKAPASGTRRRVEAYVLGEHDFAARLTDATVPELFARTLAPSSPDAPITEGMIQLADELAVLGVAILADSDMLTPRTVNGLVYGLEQRLRVLAEVADRALSVVERTTPSPDPQNASLGHPGACTLHASEVE